jgi:hypothetical protein
VSAVADGQPDSDRLGPRLAAVAVLGFLLFAPPLLSLFDRKTRVLGVPVLWVYLFGAWAVVIGLVAAINRSSGRDRG